jgi:hypothetical protein
MWSCAVMQPVVLVSTSDTGVMSSSRSGVNLADLWLARLEMELLGGDERPGARWWPWVGVILRASGVVAWGREPTRRGSAGVRTAARTRGDGAQLYEGTEAEHWYAFLHTRSEFGGSAAEVPLSACGEVFGD